MISLIELWPTRFSPFLIPRVFRWLFIQPLDLTWSVPSVCASLLIALLFLFDSVSFSQSHSVPRGVKSRQGRRVSASKHSRQTWPSLTIFLLSVDNSNPDAFIFYSFWFIKNWLLVFFTSFIPVYMVVFLIVKIWYKYYNWNKR